MKDADLINTSTIAKLYRTTTGDIEKKLKNMGLKPVRTVVMQSGRRFMLWDKSKALQGLDEYKARRMEELKHRDEQRKELAEKQFSIPRTGYGVKPSEDSIASDFAALDEPAVPVTEVEKLREELSDTKEQLNQNQQMLKEVLELLKAQTQQQ